MPPEILSLQVFDSSWASFMRVQVRLGDGTVVGRQIEAHGTAASILPYDPKRRMALLVRLFRAPAFYADGTEAIVETVAGIVDPGEDPAASARREAMEEAGVRLGELEFVGRVWSSPGISTERMSLYLAPYAAADRIAAGGGLAEEHEGIEVLELSLAELAARVRRAEVDDMKVLALVQALMLRQPELFA